MSDIVIRSESDEDRDPIRVIHCEAFGRSEEAELVDELRLVASPYISLVAARGSALVGHILFTPVHVVDADPSSMLVGLGPMAVTPGAQRAGVGSRLVRAGLSECRAREIGAVFVLGHPELYPRFGFVPAHTLGFQFVSEAFADAFFVQELRPGALVGLAGHVRYLPPFEAV